MNKWGNSIIPRQFNISKCKASLNAFDLSLCSLELEYKMLKVRQLKAQFKYFMVGTWFLILITEIKSLNIIQLPTKDKERNGKKWTTMSLSFPKLNIHLVWKWSSIKYKNRRKIEQIRMKRKTLQERQQVFLSRCYC